MEISKTGKKKRSPDIYKYKYLLIPTYAYNLRHTHKLALLLDCDYYNELNIIHADVSKYKKITNLIFYQYIYFIVKCKVLYGQEPPSGESTTTECGVNYQLLAVMY